MMKLALSLKRMDSLELLYTCVANLVKEAAARKEEPPEEQRAISFGSCSNKKKQKMRTANPE